MLSCTARNVQAATGGRHRSGLRFCRGAAQDARRCRLPLAASASGPVRRDPRSLGWVEVSRLSNICTWMRPTHLDLPYVLCSARAVLRLLSNIRRQTWSACHSFPSEVGPLSRCQDGSQEPRASALLSAARPKHPPPRRGLGTGFSPWQRRHPPNRGPIGAALTNAPVLRQDNDGLTPSVKEGRKERQLKRMSFIKENGIAGETCRYGSHPRHWRRDGGVGTVAILPAQPMAQARAVQRDRRRAQLRCRRRLLWC